jgi:eukaryotic-like serine/threonine-protein kinase
MFAFRRHGLPDYNPVMETIETLGKYEIKRPLGRGAMGTVYEGWDPIIARRVAIKTVRLPDNDDPETEEALARFRREAQAAGRLTHPNIVGVFDYGETNDLAYIVMEFVDGPPLKTWLDKQERFALADAVRVMEDLLAGLQFSHERGVVHRDIKPANVMLTSSGQAKIADFGIARIESSSMTQAGTLLGTPAYMSPEQFMGQVVDARTDIYSSGVLLYQLLTGERPFEGGMSAIMHKALNTEPPAPSQLSVTAPPSFDAVVRRAMAKRPQDRFASAKAFAEAIRTAVTQQAEPAADADEQTMFTPPPAPPPRPVEHAPPPRVAPVATPPHRSAMPIAAAAVALLGLMGGGAWWFLARPPAPVIATTTAPAPPPAAEVPLAPGRTPTPPSHSEPSQPPPAQTVAPPLPPDTQQLALAGLDALRGRIAQWANSRSCAALGGDVADGGAVKLNGLASDRSIEGLRQGLAALVPPGQIDWRVTGVAPVFCPALDALHIATPAFGATDVPRLGLQMAEGKTSLRDGEPVRVRVVMPDFPGWLRVDYVVHDGTVQHLYPQLADPKIGIAADRPKSYAPGETINLANPSWLIGPPYGTDMIVAVAASDPLFDHPRASNSESAEAYLGDLYTAIDSLRQHRGRISGAGITLEALPPK